MKLSKRIGDLVRASLASPRRLSRLGKDRSPKRMEAQLEQIRKSLVQAAGREKRLQDDLALAEGEGRERDAIRLRRELADLDRSRDELQAALDLIEARIEMERESKVEAPPSPSVEVSPTAEGADSRQTSLSDEEDDEHSAGDDDLTARKVRLSAPEKK